MANKITKAMNDSKARENAIAVLNLDKLAKVSNTEFALMVENAEGTPTVVTVKLTVPKAQLSIEEMVDNYAADTADKAQRAQERAEERAAAKAAKEKAPKATKSKAKETAEEIEF